MDLAARIALIQAQTVCALAEIEGMKAANNQVVLDALPGGVMTPGASRELPYQKADFDDVPRRFCIGENDVLGYLRG